MTSRRPPSARNARYADQQQDRQLQSMSPGAMYGRLASAQPILGSAAQSLFGSEAGAGAAAAGTPLFINTDTFTLTSSGAQTVTLTYVPISGSEHVYLNGIWQDPVTPEWTRTDRTVSLLTAMDPRSGDKLNISYAYEEQTSSPAIDEADINIPFQATGWKWHTLASSGLLTSYVDPATDDSTWSVGQMPFGWGSFTDLDGHTTKTTIPHVNTGQLGHEIDMVARRWMPPATGISLTYDEKNYLTIYINGTAVGGSSTGNPVKATISLPDQASTWLLGLYLTVANGATDGGLDISVSGTLA